MDQKKSRIVLTLFFVVLIAATFLLLHTLVPRISSQKSLALDTIPRWTCLEVISGDLIRVAHEDTTNLIHVAGISTLPAQPGAALDQAARTLGLPTDEALKRGHISRKSLTTWIYRRTVKLIPQPDLTPSMPDALEAYVEVSGVDVGKKMLQNGQAYAQDVEHSHREAYEGFESAAKTLGIGIWRDL